MSEAPPDAGSERSLPGLVYTFYSYKGGVGRSMALANVGVLMATEGHRVLLVDWDLEAPGLETFFRNTSTLRGDPSKTPGIVDLLHSQAEGTPLDWRECLLEAQFFDQSLDILSSGCRGDGYRRRVQQLDWDALYGEHGIGDYLDSLRNDWRNEYDFVLIDSRTGVTDIGDVCTVILPDVLVLMFVTNDQNVQGIKDAMARAVRARSKLPVNRSKLLGVPVPSRDERYHDYDRSVEWQQRFAAEFGELYREWLPKNVAPEEALNKVFLPYVSGWSFGERIPVIESTRERSDPTSLGAAYARLAALLSNRLDWSAIEERASRSEVVGQRAELWKAREAARDAELRLAEEAKRREEQAQREADERRRLEAKLEEVRRTSKKSVMRMRSLLLGGPILALAAAAGAGYWYYNPSAERLVARFASGNIADRYAALGRVELLAADDPTVFRFAPDVARLLTDSAPVIRGRAATALGHMGASGAEFAPQIAGLLSDPDGSNRREAARVLGGMGQSAAHFAPGVAALLRDPDAGIRDAASAALKELAAAGADCRGFVPDLVSLLQDPNPDVRQAAAATLSGLGGAAAPCAPILAKALTDPDLFTRQQAVQALGNMGNAEAAKSVAPLLRDRDPAVRAAAEQVMRRLIQGARTRAIK